MEHNASVADVFIVLILSSFFIERGLAFIYETEYFLNNYGTNSNAKTAFALLVSLVYAFLADINIVSISYNIAHGGESLVDPLLRFEHWLADASMITVSFVITACILAGGCKPFIKLFRDVWGIQTLRAKAAGNYASESLQNKAPKAAAGNSEEQTDLYDQLDQASQIKHKKRKSI
jgi:hypothetical protein